MIKIFNHRLFLPMVCLIVTWMGCGLQTYLIHINNVQKQEINSAMQRVKDATLHMENVKRQMDEESERLQKLLKMLPPQPAPDHTSKL